jgi:glycosyl hydrolase family 88
VGPAGRTAAAVVLAIALSAATGARAFQASDDLESSIRAVAALPGEPNIVAAAAVARDDRSVLTIENASAFDAADSKRRVIVVGAPSGDARAAVEVVRWFKTRAPQHVRAQWALSALPLAAFDDADTQSLLRWVTFQAPDLVVTIGTVPLQIDCPVESLASEDAAAFAKLLEAARGRSALHTTIAERVARPPLAIARLLAQRYPEAPSISYIPALSWVGALRLATIDRDDRLRAKVLEQTAPWRSGEKKLFGDRIQLTAAAGTMVFSEIAAESRRGVSADDVRASQDRFEEGVRAASKEKAPDVPEYGGGWTDDMFMSASVLARSGARPGHESDLDRETRLLFAYAAKLQRSDGLFNHAVDGPAAWGRGNGFAALGMVETLQRLPAAHPARGRLLELYRRQMSAVRAHQSPDGSWREVIDEPGAYREETATAMLLSAMARGIRLGWVDASYRPVVQRAWRALTAHVASDATLVDVCASTGGGPTKRYYLDRPAITGPDDRGAAMALIAALDMHDLDRR